MKFKPGQLAVYPKYGVGRIESIVGKSFGTKTVDCYLVNIEATGSKIFVPIDSAAEKGLRNITDKSSIQQVYSCFKTQNKSLLKLNWNKRYRFLQEKMNTGKIVDVASVISDLLFIKKRKSLSFGEKKMLEEAENIVFTELAIAENDKTENVKSKIYETMGLS